MPLSFAFSSLAKPPKYPQFARVTQSAYDRMLLELASDPAISAREDSQLAAEYLLSAYTPHDGDRLVEVFERVSSYDHATCSKGKKGNLPEELRYMILVPFSASSVLAFFKPPYWSTTIPHQST